MNVAILGATSQIAKDLVISSSVESSLYFYLFARNPEDLKPWLDERRSINKYRPQSYDKFNDNDYDVIINFVGAGNPVQIHSMGVTIFDVTLHYDLLALDYLRRHPKCRYIFMSSGAAYGSSFEEPVDNSTSAVVPINSFRPCDWYSIAKLYAECRHRSLPDLSIVDVRIFNYFSHTQDINARFLITDIVRAIKEGVILKTSSEVITRDYIHPTDFYKMIKAIIFSGQENTAIDCYSLSPVTKHDLLESMSNNFGLNYEYTTSEISLNATGGKPNYYSLNKRAEIFGFKPCMTSLEGLILEVGNYFQHIGSF